MPGISLIYKKNLEQAEVSGSLIDLKHEQNFKIQKILNTTNSMAVLSGYEGYPRQYSEDENTVIFVEGIIYNRSDAEIERLLRGVATSYIENNDYKNLIKEFIDNCDGDFIILIHFKGRNESIIFNDRWGRLPSYYYQDDDMFILSRELKFILNFIPSIEFDKTAIVEFLVFEYVLGDKTLINNIHRVSPSCMFNLRPSDNMLEVEIEKVFDVNFEELLRPPSKNECIEKCRELFLQSMECRLSKIRERKYNITADLSGGCDTRTVLAGLCKFDTKVDCYTDALITGDESEYASKVAALYNNKLVRVIASHDMSPFDMRKITYMTDCTVNGWTALSAYNDSLERTKLVKRKSVKFMGFGGEFIRHPYKAPKGYKTIPDMLKDGYFVRRIQIKQACSFLNLDEEAFYNYLISYFNQYPESTLTDKIKHLYFEYYNNLVNAGENRHRLHFWTVQPLWSKDLFNFEMKCIPIEYVGVDFYRTFMRAIDPNLLNVPIYAFNIKLNSKMSSYIAHLIGNLKDYLNVNRHTHKRLFDFAFRIYKYIKKSKITATLQIKRDLFENYSKLSRLSSYLNEIDMHKFMESEHDDDKLYQLLTLILYFQEIEKRYGDKITIS